MNLVTEPFLAQQHRWPAAGRVVLAQFDATTAWHLGIDRKT